MQVQLTLSPEHDEVIAGESIPVTVHLLNSGSAPAEVPHHLGPSPFEFVVRAADGRVVQTLSARRAASARYGETERPLEIDTETLAPGASFDYSDDLAGLMPTPLAPGEYRLSVTMAGSGGPLESDLTPLFVTTPRVRSFSGVADLAGNLDQVLAHETAGQRIVIFHAASREGAPGDATWYRRVEGTAAVRSVAAAATLANDQRLRWFAWLQDDAVGAGVSDGRYLAKRIDPVPVGLRSASLHDVGWQVADTAAVFVVLGMDGAHTALAAVQFDRQSGVSVRRARLAAAALPAHWAAQYHAQGPARFDVVWASQEQGRSRIYRQTVASATASAEAPVLLAERNAPVAALAMGHVGVNAEGAVDVLFGPVGAERLMYLLRLPLRGGNPAAQWKFRPPESAGHALPSEWILSREAVPDPVVFAKLSGRLLMRHASDDSEWSELPDSASAGVTRAEAVSHRLWAIWADPAVGLRYQPIP